MYQRVTIILSHHSLVGMHLLALTQQYATAIHSACYGSFSKPGAQELIVSKGRILELYSIDDGSFKRVTRQDCFSLIRGLTTVRLAGQSKDILVVSSDSGRLSFVSVSPTGQFRREACETYGKWSMRRVCPGTVRVNYKLDRTNCE